MLVQYFTGREFGYTYDIATGNFHLYTKDHKGPVTLEDDDALMFKNHLELINAKQDNTLAVRTERIIEIHYNFATKPCPMPQFLE